MTITAIATLIRWVNVWGEGQDGVRLVHRNSEILPLNEMLRTDGPGCRGTQLLYRLNTQDLFAMIDLYFWPTPNGCKPLIMLEEVGAGYAIKPVNIMRGRQRDAAFLKLNPNGRMPVLVDHAPAQGQSPIVVLKAARCFSTWRANPERRHDLGESVFRRGVPVVFAGARVVGPGHLCDRCAGRV